MCTEVGQNKKNVQGGVQDKVGCMTMVSTVVVDFFCFCPHMCFESTTVVYFTVESTSGTASRM
jgi:hypothetical protein